MKKIIVISLSILILIGVALVFFMKPIEAEKTGITIRCALIGYGDYEALYKKIPEFERATGHTVEIVYLNNHFELDKKLKNDFLTGSVHYDVISDHTSFFTQYIPYLEPLNNYFSPKEQADFLPRILNSGKQGGNLYLIPRHADISVLNYRTDIFGDESLKEQYLNLYGTPLKPPEDWKEFERQALFFSEYTKLKGTQFAGREEALTGRFYEIMFSNGGRFLDDNGYAVFNSKKGIQSAQMLKTLYQQGAMPQDMLSYLWDDLAKNFARGEVVMYMEWHSYTNMLSDPERSVVAGKYDIARLPKGDMGVCAGWVGVHGFSITKASKNKEAASELIRFLTNSQNQYEECEIGYLPVRASVWDSLLQSVKTKNNAFEEKRLNLAREQFANDSYTPPLTPRWIAASDILFPILQQIMLDEVSVSEGLNNAVKQVNSIKE